ncbi:MAG TPA: hypothetical protein VHA52_09860 [Candidatus Babeliaceae bacterium]|nr:hypothetical protein [Candidatus Babeliaceae bacterium]
MIKYLKNLFFPLKRHSSSNRQGLVVSNGEDKYLLDEDLELLNAPKVVKLGVRLDLEFTPILFNKQYALAFHQILKELASQKLPYYLLEEVNLGLEKYYYKGKDKGDLNGSLAFEIEVKSWITNNAPISLEE